MRLYSAASATTTIIHAILLITTAHAQVAVENYNQVKDLCGYAGSRANCEPIIATATTAPFMNDEPSADFCFLIDANPPYARADSANVTCRELKLYGNGVITYSTGGLYSYTNRQSSRNQYERGDIEYAVGGGGGYGVGHSQGAGFTGGADKAYGTDFYVLRQGTPSVVDGERATNVPNDHYDFYELRDGIYTFGYYECNRIVEGGAIDDYQYHYYCSGGFDLFQGCLNKCGVGDYNDTLADYRTFNFTSSLLGHIEETQTSQIFS